MHKAIIKKLSDNLFIIVIGIIYYFSFSGLSIGDLYYRCLENGYPLFAAGNFCEWPVWLGFDFPHILNIPTFRAFQILISKIGLTPSPLVLVQLVNLVLALSTLKIMHSILLRINPHKFLAKLSIVLFGFSYAFFATMNGEMYHFSVFLFAFVLWLLLEIKNKPVTERTTLFVFWVSLSLIPLYHLENIIYIIIILLYILLNLKLRLKFFSRPAIVLLGLIGVPFCLVAFSFVFHWYELGNPSFSQYLQHNLMLKRFIGDIAALSSAAVSFNIRNIYGVARAYLGSFSIISPMLTIIPNCRKIAIWSSVLSVKLSLLAIFLYILLFVITNLIFMLKLIKAWPKERSYIKLLTVSLSCYLFIAPFIFRGIYLLPEFFIIAVMLHSVLLGYYFSSSEKLARMIFSLFVLLTVFFNIVFFIYPQKVSAQSLNKIFDDIESRSVAASKINVFRVSYFDFPYEVTLRQRFKIFSDEHAYDSEANLFNYVALVNGRCNDGERKYLIAPAILFSKDKNISAEYFANGEINNNPHAVRNMAVFIGRIMRKHKLIISNKYQYNFSMLGQLGELVVIELK